MILPPEMGDAPSADKHMGLVRSATAEPAFVAAFKDAGGFTSSAGFITVVPRLSLPTTTEEEAAMAELREGVITREWLVNHTGGFYIIDGATRARMSTDLHYDVEVQAPAQPSPSHHYVVYKLVLTRDNKLKLLK